MLDTKSFETNYLGILGMQKTLPGKQGDSLDFTIYLYDETFFYRINVSVMKSRAEKYMMRSA